MLAIDISCRSMSFTKGISTRGLEAPDGVFGIDMCTLLSSQGADAHVGLSFPTRLRATRRTLPDPSRPRTPGVPSGPYKRLNRRFGASATGAGCELPTSH